MYTQHDTHNIIDEGYHGSIGSRCCNSVPRTWLGGTEGTRHDTALWAQGALIYTLIMFYVTRWILCQ